KTIALPNRVWERGFFIPSSLPICNSDLGEKMGVPGTKNSGPAAVCAAGPEQVLSGPKDPAPVVSGEGRRGSQSPCDPDHDIPSDHDHDNHGGDARRGCSDRGSNDDRAP